MKSENVKGGGVPMQSRKHRRILMQEAEYGKTA